MRIWHIKLLPALPKEQLVSQWRELSAIAGKIQISGSPNHVLVNFVMNYDFDHFISYAYYLRQEMTARGYKTMEKVWEKIVSLKPSWTLLPREKVYKEKMDQKYLTICFYNLYEKYECGMFSDFSEIEKICHVEQH